MIRKLELKDKESWAKLYDGYADFYKVPMNTRILDTLWGWIQDETHNSLHGLKPQPMLDCHLV